MISSSDFPDDHLTSLSYFNDPNPFDIPSDMELLERRDAEVKKHKENQKVLSKQSLVQRNSTIKSPIYSAGKSLSKKNRKSTASILENNTTIFGENQRRQQMNEFIEQKREIFLVQLLIDRKVKEIERISQTRKTEKKNLADEVAKISETSNQYKMTRNQIDSELQRGKTAMDEAIKHRTELAKELKQKRALVSSISSEIVKNEELLDSFKSYEDFLKKISPNETTPKDYFQRPAQLLYELEKIEKENLFLIRRCHELAESQETGLTRVSLELERTKNEKDRISNAMNGLEKIKKVDLSGHKMKDSGWVDDDLKIITNHVKKTYMTCFRVSADINALTMLERIENSLENLYSQCSQIDNEHLSKHLMKQEMSRRDVMKKQKQAKDEEEQRKKLEQAIERANKPIKRKMGRPVHERYLPIKSRRPYDEQRKEFEEKAQDEFLFGEITD